MSGINGPQNVSERYECSIKIDSLKYVYFDEMQIILNIKRIVKD